MTLGRAAALGLFRAAVGMVLLAPILSSALADDLTVATPGGALTGVLDKAFLQPFAHASGIAVTTRQTDGTLTAAKASHADMAVLGPMQLSAGCKDGSLAKLDWPSIGGRDRALSGTASDCGAGAILRSLVLAWNRDKYAGTPNWGDFWDVAKLPGKRGLRRGSRGNLEFALMADGVAPADVYSTLRSDGGIDRAFRKLDQLKPYVVWWQGVDEPPKLLESGEVLMTSSPAERIVAAQRGDGVPAHPSFALQWAGSLGAVDSWAVLAGTHAMPAAVKLLDFATDPRNQRILPTLGAYGGTSTGADDGLPQNLLAISPSAPNNVNAALMQDDAFWAENEAKLDARFEAWLAR